jgi:serine/threonine-protein kinase RsbW
MNPGMGPARSSRCAPGTDTAPGAVPPGPPGLVSDPEPPGDSAGLDGHPDISPRYRRAFPGHASQVARARRFVAGALAGCLAAPDAILLTSELATNAVQHSASGRGGFFTVAISHAAGRVRVTVTDDGSATRPAVAVADEMATSGRGLLLVDCLACRWGHVADPGRPGGGAVWFELACT